MIALNTQAAEGKSHVCEAHFSSLRTKTKAALDFAGARDINFVKGWRNIFMRARAGQKHGYGAGFD
jgi:hypothetical protein